MAHTIKLRDVYENPDFDWREADRVRCKGGEYNIESGTLIEANCIVLKQFHPTPEREGDELTVQEANNNMEGLIINLCPDCMRKLLKKAKPDSGDANCFRVV